MKPAGTCDGRAARADNPFTVLALVFGGIVLFAIALYGIGWGDMQSGRAVECLSGVRQLSLAAAAYRSDNDGQYWLVGDFQRPLIPYTASLHELARCPLTKDKHRFNKQLLGATIPQIKEPERTVEFYEGKASSLDFVHLGRASVSFADGHSKAVSFNLRVLWGKK